jgi:ankyrin repeat protein
MRSRSNLEDAVDTWRGMSFERYACMHWPHQARTVQDEILDIALRFLLSEPTASGRLHIYDWLAYGHGNSAAHIAAYFGLEALLKHVIMRHPDSDIEAVNMTGSTPLKLAARQGHECTVKLLLEYGAGVNNCCGTALSHAARLGHDGIVTLLPTKAPLSWPTVLGCEDIV